MTVLVDTHVFLWCALDDPRLSPRAREILQDPRTDPVLSVASAWEVVFKAQAGKLKLPGDPVGFLRKQLDMIRMEPLRIELSHVLQLARLPLHHRDPFDRMLAAQSQAERIPIVTADPSFTQYDVEIIW